MRYHVDGELVDAEAATVSVEDRGFRYGDAVFTTIRAYGGTPHAWEGHADRLLDNAATLEIDHGLSREALRARVDETLAANDLADAYVRLSISRGVQPGKLTPSPDAEPTVVIVVKPLPRGGREGDPVWSGPATLQTVKRRKPPASALPPELKSHNYLTGILARLELAEGADEALLRDHEGYVAEGATSNLFFVRDDALHTPDTNRPILPGITRSTVIELAEDAGIPVRSARYHPEDVRNASEIFLTNSTWELRPVDRVDGIAIDRGPVTELLTRLFDRRIEERHYGDGGE